MLNSFLYRKAKPLETNISRAQMLQTLQEKEVLLWVDFENPDEFESDALVEIFNFHALAIEDCLTDLSQPKVDDYEEYLFLVVHALQTSAEKKLRTVELDLFLGKNFVITFHKEPVTSITQIRENAVRKPEVFFGHGADRLVHVLLDQLVDNYLPVMDAYDEKIEALEEAMFNHHDSGALATLMELKRDVFHLRRIIVPQRDMVNYLTKNPSAFMKPKHLMYFRDVYDHLFRLYGVAEGFHETLSSLLQAYFSYSSHRLNEVMKRMTILATVTMPAVIIASIYGMNFRHIPELDWRYGYYFSLALILGTSAFMLLWMKYKKWF